MTQPLTQTDYARSVAFKDRNPAEVGDFPVHVTSQVLLDGRSIPGLVDASLTVGYMEPTVVECVVLAEEVAPPFVDSDGVHVPAAIGGVPVLACAGPWVSDDDGYTVVCRFYVAHVIIG